MDWVKDATVEDAGVMALGMFAGFVAHETGHAVTKDGSKATGHAGFLSQTVLATVLTSFEATRYSYFTRGVVALNAGEIWSYPLRRGTSQGDIGLMGENGTKYWAGYSAVALHNVLREKW